MKEAWNLYLVAFKNIFNYKKTAERKELICFFSFMFIFWLLSGMFFIGCCILLAISGKHIIPVLFFAFFIYAGIYFIGHGLPLISLVKRRFNFITPTKSTIFWSGWLCIWLVQLTICISMFLTVKNAMSNINPLSILPLAFIGQFCGLLVIGTIIFLMIRQKPIC